MNALNFGVKRSQWNNICWNHHVTCGGIQYSTSCVELDFLVCILFSALPLAAVVFVRRQVGAASGACSTMNAVTDKALARPAACRSQRSEGTFRILQTRLYVNYA